VKLKECRRLDSIYFRASICSLPKVMYPLILRLARESPTRSGAGRDLLGVGLAKQVF
jgi:hypothetical protein